MPVTVSEPAASGRRVVVDGKFFRLGDRKFWIKGLTYGPFAANPRGEMFPEPDQAARDLAQIRQLGANVLRVYYPPPAWFLDLAAKHGLKVLVDIPWPKHLCFLDSRESQAEARQSVRQAVKAAHGHPAILAYSVVNEISAEIIRWSGVARVERFIDRLIDEGRSIDPSGLFTFTSYPPTEFLRPENPDFLCFNVYLHEARAHDAYLARLQTLADTRPLVLGEFGMDSIREGETRQGEFLAWQIEGAFRNGLAGAVVFSYTDDWFRGGMRIEDWGFGLTTREREPKASFHAVQRQFQVAPHFPLPRRPKVSVVVATYNGARTLRACLESLRKLNYPDYEVILVDDGSKDQTPAIAAEAARTIFQAAPDWGGAGHPSAIEGVAGEGAVGGAFCPRFVCVRQENLGLSAARNAGIKAATGEIVAFTDDDCRVDEDWLFYLISDLLRGGFAGIGGPNLLPPEDSNVSAAVQASPGGPAHVLLTDREAEHVPGCNMAFYKWALEQVGLFDPVFRKAGDDVDICWRLQANNLKIGFSPAGFVWHFRRSTVKAYLKQQAGYGEAEALLEQKHPDYFNSLGGGVWRGRIYAQANPGLVLSRSVIYHGVFGSGFFQRLYTPKPSLPLMLCTTLGYHVFVSLPLLILSVYVGFLLPVALASVILSLAVCGIAGWQAPLPRHKLRFWSRHLVALLFFLQPIVRGWARFRWRLRARGARNLRLPEVPAAGDEPTALGYWSKGDVDRYRFLHAIQEELGRSSCIVEPDTGWEGYDLDIIGNQWSRLRLTTTTEDLEQGKRNFRCRLTTMWPLRARLLFGTAVSVELILVAMFADWNPWVWFLPVSLPLLYWFFAQQGEDFRAAIISRIDHAAEGRGLVKLADADDSVDTNAASSTRRFYRASEQR